MFRIGYIVILLSSVGIFNSCTGSFINLKEYTPQYAKIKQEETLYGNYLAGRVAHIRQDYANASKFYIKTIEKGLINNDILSKTYIILASQGKIDEAYKYANQARLQGDTNNFIDVINAVYAFQKGNYEEARQHMNLIEEKTYKNLITPLFNAWCYVGENNYEMAEAELNILKDQDDMKTVYNLHSGLIADYFKKNDKARKYFEFIIQNKANDMSFRALQLIADFYVRQGEKNYASSIITKYYATGNLKEMLNTLNDKILKSTSTEEALIKTAKDGISEVFLEIALLFKSVPVGYDYAQMYMALSEFFNSNNDVTKIAMADIFEERMLYKEANNYYDLIKRTSELYYPAQIKKANNLQILEKYNEAEKVLKRLLRNNPNNFQILFNLGDVLRINNKQSEAIKYYNQAIGTAFYESEKYWPVYYALAVSYDKNNEWQKAETSLEKALKLSNRNPQVLNYLGYSWLKYNINTDKAASMILEAYEKEPNDGIIIDSLGWVYFKTGDYNNAITYLEKASELNPKNAVISDHLGDAYWYGGRKNEAVFQWKHALKQKEESEELNITKVKNKIQNGLKSQTVLTIEDKDLSLALKQLEEMAN